jgi:urease alpha subunit
MNRFITRKAVLAATATIAAMLAGIGVAAGTPSGDHARVAAIAREVRKLKEQVNDRVGELKGELNDLRNFQERHRLDVQAVRRALATPNVVKVVETRPLVEGGAVDVDAFCPRGDQVISGGYVQGASNGEVTRAVPIQKPSPGYEVAVFEQPGIGTGNQDTTVTAVAYCAPAATVNPHTDKIGPPSATVFGAEIPAG